MPKFAANLTMLFNEVAFPDRFKAAADCGFEAIEYLFPYARSKQDLALWQAEHGLSLVLINMPGGDWEGGERGLTCLPGRTGEFEDAIARAIDYARALDCPTIHAVAGLAPPAGPERMAFEDTYRRNLAHAADAAAAHGITITIEAINGRDAPGFFLQTSVQAMTILADIGRPNLRFQFDAYHVQIMEGDLIRRLRACLPRIGHIQIANPPDRHEPDIGETNYRYFFAELDALGYDGYVGCEYKPKAGTAAGLGWGADYGLGIGRERN
jgi:hydroxypyruvate isomerase